MSFNISRFKSTLDKYGGPARSSLFEVIISKYPETNSSIDPVSEFSFFCKSANFPGLNIENQTMTAVSQMPLNFPNTITQQPFSAIFLVDSDHQVLSFFHNWMQRVLNYSTKGGMYGAVDTDSKGGGLLPYEVGYKDEYSCRITMRHYSTESFGRGDKYYEVVLDNCYPFQIGDLDMAWESNDSFLTLPVSFSYDRIYFSGDRTGNPSNRSRGLLETLSDLAGFANTVKQTLQSGKPQSIQDAVNRLTRVRNSFDNLTSSFPSSSKDSSTPKTGG